MTDGVSVLALWVRYKVFPIPTKKCTRSTEVEVLTNRLWREGRRWASTQSVTHSLTMHPSRPCRNSEGRGASVVADRSCSCLTPINYRLHNSASSSVRPLLQNTGAPEGRAGHFKVAAVVGRNPVHRANTILLVGQPHEFVKCKQ